MKFEFQINNNFLCVCKCALNIALEIPIYAKND